MDWHKDIGKSWILTLMVPNDSFHSGLAQGPGKFLDFDFDGAK